MTVFTSRAFETEKSGAVLNNVAYDRRLLREAIAQTEWEGATTEVEPLQGGMITCLNAGDTGVVKRVTIPETSGSTNYRFAYMKDADGPAVYGQQIGPLAEKNAFLYSDIEIVEQRTARFGEHSNRQKRLGYNTLQLAGGSKAMAQALVKQSAGRQVNHDHFAALIRGACDAYLAPQTEQGLEANIGGVNDTATTNGSATVAGSQALHENIVMPGVASATTMSDTPYAIQLTSSLAASRVAYEDKVGTYLSNLQNIMTSGSAAEKAKALLSRDSLKGMRYWASKFNIRPLNGSNYDYKLIVDWEVSEALVGTLSGSENDTLVAILKLMAQGGGSKDSLLDLRQNNLVVDGILIQPSRHLQGWRPAPTGLGYSATDIADAGAKVSYARTGANQTAYWAESKKRAYETNNNNVGLAFLCGDTTLVHATDGALRITEEKGAHETGMEWQGQTYRSIKRGTFEGKDPATANQLRNESSIQFFFGVPANLGAI